MPAAKKQTKNTVKNRNLGLLGVVFVVALGWFWWQNIQMNADRVFWGMIDNNLSTASVTRHLIQESEGRSLDQYIRIQFGAVNAVKGSITLKQNGQDGQNVVKSETIGTPTVDYSRYLSISTPNKDSQGKPIDTNQVIGVWGKSVEAKDSKSSASQYYQQSVLTLIPYGNFSLQQRQTLVNLMHNKDVYSYDSSAVKSVNHEGKPAFVYEVNINASAYIELLQQYAKELGIGDIGLDPSMYANSPPLKAEITVIKLSRQIAKISYPDNDQFETVTDQNLDQPISLPTNTIPMKELQDRVQKITQ